MAYKRKSTINQKDIPEYIIHKPVLELVLLSQCKTSQMEERFPVGYFNVKICKAPVVPNLLRLLLSAATVAI